jgi:hypothetical protein
MNEKQQRIAIAETCGFINVRMWGQSCIASIGISDKGEYWGSLGVPDYLNDLNAMHEAEKMLYGGSAARSTLPKKYTQQIKNAIRREAGVTKAQMDFDVCITATAAQRAEAFLKTIDKWTTNPNEL